MAAIPAGDPVARATGVVKRFGALTALDGVDIEILPGRITGLVGPDAAGKTTLIRILAGLMSANEGELRVLGGAPGEDLEDLGYMPQRFGLYEDLSVIQNLNLYADLRGLPTPDKRATFDRLLAFTDLASFEDRPAGKLSGGMKQKLGLACALVKTPRLLLLDEPGVGVDPISRRELWAMVKELTGEGIGVLWSTAYLDEAEKCDAVCLLNDGKLLYSGDPAGLTERMEGRVYLARSDQVDRRPLLRSLLDNDAVLDATIQGSTIRLLSAGGERPQIDGVSLTPVPPKLEDGFIEILGGGPKGTSALAEAYTTFERSGQPAIEAVGLTKRYGDFTAANQISFTARPGQIFGLLGPNGAGKSTTFKMLCGLATPTEGQCAVAGHDLKHSGAAARQSLGYMAQKFSLYGDLSVRQNLDFFAGAYGLAGGAARAAIDKVVDIFELGEKVKVNAGQLPLGYKQRLALACAVMHEPPVLFLDEPTSGVDPVMRREFWVHINGLVARGVCVLVTTHFMEEAEYCDDILLIYRSEQIATGSPDDLKRQAAEAAGLDDPTMEDAFIALIEASHIDTRNPRKAA
ncbi:MAG: ABC transporter ATP-binding protein [Sphingomonadales bacterium]|nr:ABC transporter ATP-binding protein [Sphingomonadales bacterium]MBD3774641.1 ABC transporter ATP-binding protein [Paracoccaceae bacterium]